MSDRFADQSANSDNAESVEREVSPVWRPAADRDWRKGVAAAVDRAWLALGVTFEREMEAGRGFLWVPVAFGIGVLLYFALPREPSAIALWALVLVFVAAAWGATSKVAVFRLLVVLAAVASGALAAKVRTDGVASVPLRTEMTATVTGWIADKEEASRGGDRVLIRVRDIDAIRVATPPETVRVTIRSGSEELPVGGGITVLARLRPPPGPVMPGGYDFARAAFYEGIGAVEFAYGAAHPADIGPAPLAVRLQVPLAICAQRFRNVWRRRCRTTTGISLRR